MSNLRRALDRFRAVASLTGIVAASRIYMIRKGIISNKEGLVQIPVEGLSAGLQIRPKGSDLGVVLQIFLTRHYDLDWCAPYRTYIEEVYDSICLAGDTPVIIDAGANIGASTVWFAQKFPKCLILAVEPDAENFRMLERNTKDYPNVKLFNAGLWDRSTNLSMLHNDDDNWSRRVQEEENHDLVIPSVTISDLLESEATLRPVIVKIDIEGAETSLFRTNTNWVNKIPLIIFEPHDNLWHWLGTWQGTGHAFFATLSRRKREYLFRGENVFAFLHPDLSRCDEAADLASEKLSGLPHSQSAF